MCIRDSYDGALAADGVLKTGRWVWCLVIGALIIVWILVGITNLGKINTIAMAALFILTLVLCKVCLLYTSNMEIAEFYLEDMKIKVDKAWNGKEAVEMFAASEPGTYDMILMDIMMPVKDGLEAARNIRQMERIDAKKIPILALTAQVTSESIVECCKAGMDGHLTKPIEAQKLK